MAAKNEALFIWRTKKVVELHNSYVNLRRQGKEDEEIIAVLQDQWQDRWDNERCRELFWVSLADAMWKYGRIPDLVRSNAKHAVKSRKAAIAKLRNRCPGIYADQMRFITYMEDMLHTDPDHPRKITRYQLFENNWEPGEVLAYRLSEAAGELAGQYVFVHVVRKQLYWPGHLVPVVRVFRKTLSELPGVELSCLSAGGYLPQYWGPDAYDGSSVNPRRERVLYSMLISAASIGEYGRFSSVGRLPVQPLAREEKEGANESACSLFEAETITALRRWKDSDVYALLPEEQEAAAVHTA